MLDDSRIGCLHDCNRELFYLVKNTNIPSAVGPLTHGRSDGGGHLEEQLQTKLYLPPRTSRRDRSELRGSKACVRGRKVYAIEYVECLC